MTTLHTKYRPQRLKDVLGQKATCTALEQVLNDRSNNAFCLVGPSGTGKTTLARIIASMVGANRNSLIEVDGAASGGVDAMRALSRSVIFNPISGAEATVVIVDEAHSVTKQAWQSLLKPIEEPAKSLFWIFCTTEAEKIPKTIRTRCAWFELGLVDDDTIDELLRSVCKKESFKPKKGVLGLVAEAAMGSPREALTTLALVHAMEADDAEATITGAASLASTDGLVRMLGKPALKWRTITRMLEATGIREYESLRYRILSYYARVAVSEESPKKALAILEAFREPFPPGANGKPHMLLALGELLFHE